MRFPLLSTMMPSRSANRILAFDTSSARAHVVLLEGPDVFAELRLREHTTHSTVLLSSIDFLLGRTGWSLKDLNLVVAGIGPGSFTGIRIGMATAIGMAQSLGIPMAGISGLDALAHRISSMAGRIGAVLDARRSQAFYAEYTGNHGRIRLVRKPVLVSISDLERYVAGRHLYMVGEIDCLRPGDRKIPDAGWPRWIGADLFLAADMARLAWSRKRAWHSGDFMACEPLYIRPPDALKNRTGKR